MAEVTDIAENNKEVNMNTILSTVIKAMIDDGIDYIWVSSPENHRYVTGFNNPDGRVLIGRDETVMLADFRYYEEARRTAREGITVIRPEGRMISGYVADTVGGAGKVRIGYEQSHLTCGELDKLKGAVPEGEFVPVGDIFTELRKVKKPYERECIKKAQVITDAAFSHIVNTLSPGMTELEVAAELEYFMKKSGAEAISFETIAVSGKNSSSPHKTPENRQLEAGFLTMDFGAVIDGYHSDMTRTVVIGKATAEMRHLYNTVLAAQRAVLDVISAGSGNFAMDKIARDIIDGAGYKGAFGHALGHGVGLEIHEEPTLSPRSDGSVLVPGNVVTVEPGIYIAGKYGCRIEDMVIITEDGAEDITASSKELIEIY